MASVLRRYSSDLSKVILHPNIIATALYSCELIPRASLEDACIEAKTSSSRAIKLLTDVARVLESDPTKFPTFLGILRDELEHVGPLIDKIQEDYGTFQQESREQDNHPGEQSSSSVRHRQTQQTSGRAEEDHQNQEEEEEEEEEQVSTSTIIRVVLKGIGSVILLSLIMWLGFLFIYRPPGNSPFEHTSEPQAGFVPTASSGTPSYPCHPVDPAVVYEELQTEISDSKSLGIHLGVPKVKRDIIERENQSERERLIEVLHACHDLDKCQCWEDIEVALKKYGNERKARQIREKYIR